MTTKYVLNEIFWTYQGEGANTGRRALFIRMPGCNLQCPWCDTQHEKGEVFEEESLLGIIRQEMSTFAVITGGEPLLNRHTKNVIKLLKDNCFEIACETNGTMPYIPGIDWVTCSPKKQANWSINEHLLPHISEFKYVIDDGFDFSVLERHNVDPLNGPKLYLSPEYGNIKNSLEMIFAYIQEHPWWRLSLQTHKLIGIR